MHRSTSILGRNCRTFPFSGKTLFGDLTEKAIDGFVTLRLLTAIFFGALIYEDIFIPIAFVRGRGKCMGDLRALGHHIEAKIRILPSIQIGMGKKEGGG